MLTSIDGARELPALAEITLENNPIDKNPKLGSIVRETFPSI